MPIHNDLKLSILNDIATGMAFLHGSSPRIIHRNLKSSNVLIILSAAAANEVQQNQEALTQLGTLHSVGMFQLQGIAEPEELYDFSVAGLERQFPDNEIRAQADAIPNLYESEIEISNETMEKGNFGAVYKGVWKGQTVAVKRFFKQKVDTVTAAEIEHQISDIAQLSITRHPHLLLFLGACTEPHNLFVVTEWMEMGSLRQHLSRSSRQMDRQQGIAILASTCSALTGSASEQLGKNMDVKVSDFGMAAVKSASKISTLCGSVAWMAPEVLSTATYSEASDVYSFGIVMSEIMAGEIPFKGLNKVAVAREILQGKRPDIPKVRGAYSSHFVELMSQCWSQQPSHRPTFKTIGTALETM
eukprot:m51a1_g6152 putative serine threonine kinase (359) ;mRNA; f:305148-307627